MTTDTLRPCITRLSRNISRRSVAQRSTKRFSSPSTAAGMPFLPQASITATRASAVCTDCGNRITAPTTTTPKPKRRPKSVSSSPRTRCAGKWSSCWLPRRRRWCWTCAAAWAISSTTCRTCITSTASTSIRRRSPSPATSIPMPISTRATSGSTIPVSVSTSSSAIRHSICVSTTGCRRSITWTRLTRC